MVALLTLYRVAGNIGGIKLGGWAPIGIYKNIGRFKFVGLVRDCHSYVAVTGRQHTLFQKSIIEKNALEVGCYFTYLATFRCEL